MSEAPDRNLALELVRATEAAALAAARWVGRGQKEEGDGAAVDALRLLLGTVRMDGIVIIGEGEKDEAPMLYNGEIVGNGRGPQVDVAVDPVEGTNLLAKGLPNSISVVAIAARGTLFNPGPAFYMDKLVVGPDSAGKVDINAPVADNLKSIARTLSRDIKDLTVMTLDRPRHEKLIADIRAAGARIVAEPELHDYGDASWVGYRLAELLPLPLSIKQSMLEINDAGVRLQVLQKFLHQQGLL